MATLSPKNSLLFFERIQTTKKNYRFFWFPLILWNNEIPFYFFTIIVVTLHQHNFLTIRIHVFTFRFQLFQFNIIISSHIHPQSQNHNKSTQKSNYKFILQLTNFIYSFFIYSKMPHIAFINESDFSDIDPRLISARYFRIKNRSAWKNSLALFLSQWIAKILVHI